MAQEIQKDTLFFKLDGIYVFESKYVSNTYLLEDSNDIGRGTFFFEKIGIESIKKPKEILSLKKYVHNSEYYNEYTKYKLNDFLFVEHLSNYTIYLVKKEKGKMEYIHVFANSQIE
ncbi:hypothetical protein [Formosa sp. L2A11]|uniref:hypothetical protein n=1 Tax=Formosa sp. L2A11 TaxID=2686363 RepID=UPI00131DB677|nr:hypothetical protein [Formosa sp. L2A11]